MEKITFTCETITPMFIAGADGQTPELRAPSIKGALRFWWRAVNGHLSLKELKEREAEIFGGTNPARRSSVSVRIDFNKKHLTEKTILEGQPSNYVDQFKNHFNLAWENFNRAYQGKDAAITYLFYSVLFQGKRPFIDIGLKFDIIFTSRSQECLKKVVATFWLLVHFGGIGTRTRRGAGAFAANVKEDEKNLLREWDIKFGDNQKNEIADFVQNNYQKVINLIKIESNSKKNTFTNLIDPSIFVSNHAENLSWNTVLSEVGKPFMEYRTRNKHKWDKMAIFGLPIRHKRGTVQIRKKNRRASPLIISLFKVNGVLNWVVIKMGGNFNIKHSSNDIEDLDVIMKKRGKIENGTASHQILENFIMKEIKPISKEIKSQDNE